jgi:hypothetical protein
MPTPGGLLKAGDRLVFRPQPHPDASPARDVSAAAGVVFVVTERSSSGIGYSVWLRREDGARIRWSGGTRDRDREGLLLEAHWQVFTAAGGWTLIRSRPRRGRPLRRAAQPERAGNGGADLDGMVEQLYDLGRPELRRLAWEALLIADGPDHIDGPSSTGTPLIVQPLDMDGCQSFQIWLSGGRP